MEQGNGDKYGLGILAKWKEVHIVEADEEKSHVDRNHGDLVFIRVNTKDVEFAQEVCRAMQDYKVERLIFAQNWDAPLLNPIFLAQEMPHLRILELHMPSGNSPMLALPTLCPNLQSLYIIGCSGMDMWARTWDQLTQLTLWKHTFSQNDMDRFATWIAETRVETLLLHLVPDTDAPHNMVSLCSALGRMSALRGLHINTRFSNHSTDAIIAFFQSIPPKLRSLTISIPSYTSNPGFFPLIHDAIHTAMEHNTSIRNLHLYGAPPHEVARFQFWCIRNKAIPDQS